jgi:very-short-patch-repair endonuclease
MSHVTQRVERARRLRRHQTDVERILWLRLRNRRLGGFKFKRQFPIDRFIVDFVCADARVIVELDGGQHATSPTDAERTQVPEAFGYLILRFWNNEVLENLDGVLETILAALNKQPLEPPHPNPLPKGEREPTARVASQRTPRP